MVSFLVNQCLWGRLCLSKHVIHCTLTLSLHRVPRGSPYLCSPSRQPSTNNIEWAIMNPLMVKIPVSLSKVDAYVVERFIAVTVSSVHSAPSVVHTPWRLEKKHRSPESKNITMKTVTGRGGALSSSDAMFEVCQDYFLTLRSTHSSKLP